MSHAYQKFLKCVYLVLCSRGWKVMNFNLALKRAVVVKMPYTPCVALYPILRILVSTAVICALDITKAFDKLNHFGLYIKLMNRNVPSSFLDVLICWYSVSQQFLQRVAMLALQALY